MRYPTQKGYMTNIIMNDYVKYIKRKHNITLNPDAFSLIAPVKSERIYFWQLYSLAGTDVIEKLIRTFYTNVFNDDQEWFTNVFIESGDIDYHVRGQTNFWIDVMGGGKFYKGGQKLLNLKHSHVSEILNDKGAKRWMYHMYAALKSHKSILSKDPRIIPCLLDFLQYFMDSYAVTFDFNNLEIRSKL